MERSASSSLVIVSMIFWSSGPSWISEETSETTSMNSVSWARWRRAFSTNSVPSSTIEAWFVMASTRPRSSWVNEPCFLLRSWATPSNSSRTVRTGAHSTPRVTNPVSSSMALLKRGSAYASSMITPWPCW